MAIYANATHTKHTNSQHKKTTQADNQPNTPTQINISYTQSYKNTAHGIYIHIPIQADVTTSNMHTNINTKHTYKQTITYNTLIKYTPTYHNISTLHPITTHNTYALANTYNAGTRTCSNITPARTNTHATP